MEVQDRLLQLIRDLGYNPKTFAEKLGIDPSTINHIVKGRRNKPSFDVIEKISMAFATVDLRWLITGKKGYESRLEPMETDLYKIFPGIVNDSLLNDPETQYQLKKDMLIHDLEVKNKALIEAIEVLGKTLKSK